MPSKRILAVAACAVVAAAVPVAGGARASGVTIVVDQAGHGDYTAVQAAVDAVPDNNSRPVRIVIDPGRYHEVVSIPADKPSITLAGSTGDPADVTIDYDNSAGTPTPTGGTYGTEGSATVTVAAADTTATGITFTNSFDPAAHPGQTGGQAVAVRTVADRIAFRHCRFVGRQDTLYLDATSKQDTDRVYVGDSEIAGTVDFIFGPAAVVFARDTIDALDNGSTTSNGYITAASTQLAHPYGFLFTGCHFTSDAPDGTYYLGRPWHHLGDLFAVAQVVIRDSWLGPAIKARPWTDMSGFSWVAARYDEYHNTGPGAGTSLFRPQLTDREAARYTAARYLGGWVPTR